MSQLVCADQIEHRTATKSMTSLFEEVKKSVSHFFRGPLL